MPAVLQIWIVIMTIGMLVIALLTLRLLTRFLTKASEDISQLGQAVRESTSRIDHVALEARTLLTSVRECVPPVMRVVERFESVGHRTADLSSALLDEIERPVYTAAAVARGVRSGADHFLRRLLDRFTQRYPPNHGGHHHD